jgi:hypothetical protein
MSDDEPRLINTWDQLHAAAEAKLLPKKHLLAIMRRELSVQVGSPFFQTDPKAHWTHYGKKAFFGADGTHGRARTASAIAQAVTWVQETYGYTGPWAGNARRDKVPKIVQKKFPIKRRKKP